MDGLDGFEVGHRAQRMRRDGARSNWNAFADRACRAAADLAGFDIDDSAAMRTRQQSGVVVVGEGEMQDLDFRSFQNASNSAR